jgi:hypothetical protein
MEETVDRPEAYAKAEWECPSFERLNAADAELGLLTGTDLLIVGTSS